MLLWGVAGSCSATLCDASAFLMEALSARDYKWKHPVGRHKAERPYKSARAKLFCSLSAALVTEMDAIAGFRVLLHGYKSSPNFPFLTPWRNNLKSQRGECVSNYWGSFLCMWAETRGHPAAWSPLWQHVAVETGTIFNINYVKLIFQPYTSPCSLDERMMSVNPLVLPIQASVPPEMFQWEVVFIGIWLDVSAVESACS